MHTAVRGALCQFQWTAEDMGPAETGEQGCSSPAYVCVCVSNCHTYAHTHTYTLPPPLYLPFPLFPIPPFTNLFPSLLPPSPSPLPSPLSPCFFVPLLILSSPPSPPGAVLENTWGYIASTAILTNHIWWHLVAAMDLWGSGTCDRRDITCRSSKHTIALVLEQL